MSQSDSLIRLVDVIRDVGLIVTFSVIFEVKITQVSRIIVLRIDPDAFDRCELRLFDSGDKTCLIKSC